jgi:hypothetical protein
MMGRARCSVCEFKETVPSAVTTQVYAEKSLFGANVFINDII